MKLEFVVSKCYCWFCRIIMNKDELFKVDEITDSYFNTHKHFFNEVLACQECINKYHLCKWDRVFVDEIDWKDRLDD